MTVQPYTRPHRAKDMEFVARILHASAKDGTYFLNGIDLNADDLQSRRYIVDELTTACRVVAQQPGGYGGFSLPEHHELLRILHAEVTELFIRVNRFQSPAAA